MLEISKGASHALRFSYYASCRSKSSNLITLGEERLVAAIISVMAGQGKYPNADVNEDKEVDVADISSVISIMAGK